MQECPFCAIAAGERSAHVCYEDEHCVAFLDENPASAGHTLVVPKRHVVDLLVEDPPAGAAVWGAAQDVARALDEVLEGEGFSVFHTTGDLVGSVEHAHLHVLARSEEDGVSLGLGRGNLRDEEAEELVAAVAGELSGE